MEASRIRLLVPVGGVVLFAAGFLLGWWAGSGGTAGPGRGEGIAAGAASSRRAAAQATVRRREEPAGFREGGPPAAKEGDPGEEPKEGPADPGDWEKAPAGVGTRWTESSRGAAPARAVEPPPPYALPETIRGRLVDALTGKPIPGAGVSLLWQTNDGTLGGGMSAEMAEDGSWTLDPRDTMRRQAESMFRGLDEYHRRQYATPEDLFADLEYGIRASAKGYETVEGPEPGEETDFRLVPEGRDRLPGAVRVDARWSDGSRYPGRLLVRFSSPDREGFSQWALSESDGTFLFPGVPSGPWSVIAAGKHCTGVDVRVSEAGEVRASLRVPRKGLEEDEHAPSGDPREVAVSLGDLRAGAGASVRAEARKGLFFRSEVVAGGAFFPGLPAGRWEFVLQAPEQEEARFQAEVAAGSGRLTLRFPPHTTGDAPPR